MCCRTFTSGQNLQRGLSDDDGDNDDDDDDDEQTIFLCIWSDLNMS